MDKETELLFERHLTQLNQSYLDGTEIKTIPKAQRKCLQREQQHMKDRESRVLKVSGQITPYRMLSIEGRRYVDYFYDYARFMHTNERYYMEECRERRKAVFTGDEMVHDERISLPKAAHIDQYAREGSAPLLQRSGQKRRSYNRLEAVKYAERWWDDYNPQYHHFTDNCTNFISQCLAAGGAPMHGEPDRGKGWWYTGDNWSYSWAVAHSMRWYLSGATKGLTAKEVERAKDLQPGDIICYDFEGDGHWDHNTIVVMKDGNQEPLVNAQTENSRNRYWSYEDSSAWTPNITYKFFHINDTFT